MWALHIELAELASLLKHVVFQGEKFHRFVLFTLQGVLLLLYQLHTIQLKTQKQM